jgi:hypothetical protein
MLTNENIKKLKQTNVSVDSGLTKERVKAALGAATREQKRRIDSLAGLKRTSVNRVYATGNISAKIALAIAQILELDPAWLTGESDTRGDYSVAVANAFLSAKGYKAMAEEPAPPAKRKYTRRPKPEPVEPIAEEAPEAPEEPEAAPEPAPDVSGIGEEDAVKLLRSMFIRAQYGGNVKQRLEEALRLMIP